MQTKGQNIVYQSDESTPRINVHIELNTVWLNRAQMAQLFGRDVKTIGKHINNVFKEGELVRDVVVAYFATTTKHGALEGKTQTMLTEHYNLDVIISVGYRVKSKQGTHFRIWATHVLSDYLLNGVALNQRLGRIESNHENLSREVRTISMQLEAEGLPRQGIFFEGQVFDAYVFAANLIKKAATDVILIDNYLDESVLTLFTKRKNAVLATIYTRSISKQLQLDINKHNSQYSPITFKILTESHDRFLIIDQNELYHLGASLKDLGKKWFAFSKLELPVEVIIPRLPK